MRNLSTLLAIIFLAGATPAPTEHRGTVRFGEVPVPGAAVIATQPGKTLRAITGADGSYFLADITDGAWTIQIEAPGFETVRREVIVGSDNAAVGWDVKMLPAGNLKAGTAPGFAVTATQTPALQVSTPSDDTVDRLLINGSVNNGAATPFSLANYFGNNRRGIRSLYNANIALSGGSSLFDARSFSLTGQNTPKPDYNRTQGVITIGGP